jgi:hypothetical protein
MLPCTINTAGAAWFRSSRELREAVNHREIHVSAMEPLRKARIKPVDRLVVLRDLVATATFT